MNIILFDDEGRTDLLPLTYTRPCGDLRVGILTIAEKWEHLTNADVSFLTQEYLKVKFSEVVSDDNFYINGRLLPNNKTLKAIEALEPGKGLIQEDTLIAFRSEKKINPLELSEGLASSEGEFNLINFTYDIFSKNGYQINEDFNLITTGRKSQTLSTSNTLIGENIFVEEGADVEAAVLNSKNGPIYIGKNATIMEGALIKGPFALGSSATIKMGAKIYGDTSVGPSCKVGGEVSNTLFYGNSNKGHDGFLGNSVIGEWCNLGADTNSSNLKNNYAQVKLWNYTKSRFVNSGLQFCGLIMADHSKCGINTMFNTGTVVGVSANIFGASFPRNFIPSFTWGGATGFATYSLGKAFETARIVMSRRQQELNETEKEILKNVHEISSTHRIWEKKTIKI